MRSSHHELSEYNIKRGEREREREREIERERVQKRQWKGGNVSASEVMACNLMQMHHQTDGSSILTSLLMQKCLKSQPMSTSGEATSA